MARVSYTDEATGKRQSVRRWHPLKSDAIEALPDLLGTLKTRGARPLKGELLTVAHIIKAYEDEHVKPPEIHDGRKRMVAATACERAIHSHSTGFELDEPNSLGN